MKLIFVGKLTRLEQEWLLGVYTTHLLQLDMFYKTNPNFKESLFVGLLRFVRVYLAHVTTTQEASIVNATNPGRGLYFINNFNILQMDIQKRLTNLMP